MNLLSHIGLHGEWANDWHVTWLRRGQISEVHMQLRTLHDEVDALVVHVGRQQWFEIDGLFEFRLRSLDPPLDVQGVANWHGAANTGELRTLPKLANASLASCRRHGRCPIAEVENQDVWTVHARVKREGMIYESRATGATHDRKR